eukprot:1645912-Rhodomonas_salina.2
MVPALFALRDPRHAGLCWYNSPPSVLRACYTMSGTDMHSIILYASYTMPGTDIRRIVICTYSSPDTEMHLATHMLCGVRYQDWPFLILLRAFYAVSGTDMHLPTRLLCGVRYRCTPSYALAMRCPVPRKALAGNFHYCSDLRYHTREQVVSSAYGLLRDVWYWHSVCSVVSLRSCYTMSGTETVSGSVSMP